MQPRGGHEHRPLVRSHSLPRLLGTVRDGSNVRPPTAQRLHERLGDLDSTLNKLHACLRYLSYGVMMPLNEGRVDA
ncbi:hypothetical protein IL38_08040 [Actinopolyspora erythraea]|uniref:Tn3 transposase DDE domain-containing protein n=1 Tax=Actinopolyspora erythraea TaxID=414996 RepID=A0ABR4X5H4_9ACTN|nr:hypothetical protein IL38_08040 [Actinopolyspora erythraea]